MILSPTEPLSHAFAGLGREALGAIHAYPLLKVGLAAIGLVVLGGLIRRAMPLAGGFLRLLGNIGLIYAILAGLVAVVHHGALGTALGTASGDAAEELTVSGRETRVPLAEDGHYWVRAEVNGVPMRFLVDTGATLTTVSPHSADSANLRPSRWGQEVELNTANGRTVAPLATIDTLRIGTITAHHVQAVVAPGLGETNVLGMNVLSRLAGWRVEGHTMILTPLHPNGAKPTDGV
jgi:aspartyl protease family protein